MREVHEDAVSPRREPSRRCADGARNRHVTKVIDQIRRGRRLGAVVGYAMMKPLRSWPRSCSESRSHDGFVDHAGLVLHRGGHLGDHVLLRLRIDHRDHLECPLNRARTPWPRGRRPSGSWSRQDRCPDPTSPRSEKKRQCQHDDDDERQESRHGGPTLNPVGPTRPEALAVRPDKCETVLGQFRF